jgi:hypothetical protein
MPRSYQDRDQILLLPPIGVLTKVQNMICTGLPADRATTLESDYVYTPYIHVNVANMTYSTHIYWGRLL